MMNAWARGIGVTAVADANKLVPGHSTIQFIVRSDVADEIKTGADLRGRHVAPSLPGGPNNYMFRALLEQSTLTTDDVDTVNVVGADAADARNRLPRRGRSPPAAADAWPPPFVRSRAPR
jgi:ABC-type nitrate/sulfonate/bicarbonate transport system substrate-binding protein